jgi:tripeptidyl-peptidase-1
MIAPTKNSQDLVMKWISGQNLDEHAKLSPRSDAIIIEASVARIERLLNAEYSAFGKPLFPLHDIS